MAYGLSNGHVTDDVTWPMKVLRGSTVGYPSDSLVLVSVSSIKRSWCVLALSWRYRGTTVRKTISERTHENCYQRMSATTYATDKMSSTTIVTFCPSSAVDLYKPKQLQHHHEPNLSVRQHTDCVEYTLSTWLWNHTSVTPLMWKRSRKNFKTSKTSKNVLKCKKTVYKLWVKTLVLIFSTSRLKPNAIGAV